MSTASVIARPASRAGRRGTVINVAVLHSAAIAMTVPLRGVFTLIAASKRAQTRNTAAAITCR